MFSNQPQFTVKAEANKAFDKSCLIGTFNTGDMAECFEHCLQDCRCQSFEICQNAKCQLCSSHKEDNNSLVHQNDSCIYAMYEIRHAAGASKVSKNVYQHFFVVFPKIKYKKRCAFEFFKPGSDIPLARSRV